MIKLRDCRHGRLMYYANDIYIGRSLDHYGEYSEDEIALWSQIIKPGWNVIDAGANIGAHAVWFAQAVKSGLVFAIEPQRQLYQILNGNLALNEIGNVIVVLGAVGDQVGTIKVPTIDYSQADNFGGLGLHEQSDRPGESVPLITIDSMLNQQQVHFIKIDVEGMELEVLRGARETIAAHRPVIYVENDRPEKSRGLISELMGMDYRLFWHFSRLFRPDNFAGARDNFFPHIGGINMLCVHAALKPSISGLREVRTPDDVSGVEARHDFAH